MLHIDYNYYFNYLTLGEFFTSASADGLSMEFERQKVSSNIQDSPQYPGRS